MSAKAKGINMRELRDREVGWDSVRKSLGWVGARRSGANGYDWYRSN